MAQKLRQLATFAENASSVPSTHTAANNYNSSPKGSDTLTM